VGKSNLIDRYTKGQFREETKTTIGVEFGHKQIKVDGKDIKAQIWDTGLVFVTQLSNASSWSREVSSVDAWVSSYLSPTYSDVHSYYRGAMGALLVYSVTNRSSFENCETWLDELVHHADPGKSLNVFALRN
jgi:Ras-related protein Rab-11A